MEKINLVFVIISNTSMSEGISKSVSLSVLGIASDSPDKPVTTEAAKL